LIRQGKAYYCFCSLEELTKKREAAKEEYKYDRKCLTLSEDEIQKKLADGMPRAVRFRVPEGNIVFQDLVRGHVAVNTDELDDFILLRSDGRPVYQVAVVVDDHDMGITHVIRGDDHLSNTPKQLMIYQALGWSVPEFAHVPMILGSDKKRLSKRHGATSVEEYQQKGYLPKALINYLSLIGWSPGDDREIMTPQEMIDAFSVEGISKNAGVFDEKKLEWMNSQYIHRMQNNELLEPVKDLFVKNGLFDPHMAKIKDDYLLAVISLLKSRVKRMADFEEEGICFFKDPDRYDERAVVKFWNGERIRGLLPTVAQRLGAVNEWKAGVLEILIRGLADEEKLSAGKIIHPIRLALVGKETGPGLFETMELLGKETVLRRIGKACDFLSGTTIR
jgi:glutamyl-tRNA synthetase